MTSAMHSKRAGVVFGAKGTRMSRLFVKFPVSITEMPFPSLLE